MSYEDDNEDERSLFQRYRTGIGVGCLVMAGVGVLIYQVFHSPSSPQRKAAEITMVKLALPPLPPPPPTPVPTPPPEEPPEQKMIEQAPVEEENKPEPVQQPKDVPIGTDIKGNGAPDGFNLSHGGGNGFSNGLNSRNSGPHSPYGWYATQVQTTIADALRKNSRTRSASLSIKVRVWPDITGRITRAKLVGSTGDPAVDQAIQNEVLNGLQLQEPPPTGMPVPIVMRLNARRTH